MEKGGCDQRLKKYACCEDAWKMIILLSQDCRQAGSSHGMDKREKGRWTGAVQHIISLGAM